MYADGADQPFHSLPDLIGDKYVSATSVLHSEGWSPDSVFNLNF